MVNGSIIFFSECSVRYIVGCLKLLAETGAATLEVRSDVHDAFNVKVDAANAKMAWGAPQVTSWYKNAKGRVSPELALPAGRLLDRDAGPQPGRLHCWPPRSPSRRSSGGGWRGARLQASLDPGVQRSGGPA